jgi:hypothetical protein
MSWRALAKSAHWNQKAECNNCDRRKRTLKLPGTHPHPLNRLKGAFIAFNDVDCYSPRLNAGVFLVIGNQTLASKEASYKYFAVVNRLLRR